MVVKVVTDSSSDITSEEASKWGITVVPVYIRIGQDIYRDMVDINGDEFYYRLQTSQIALSTTAPSPVDIAQAYEEIAKQTDAIVSIHITGKHSAVCDAARAARELVQQKRKSCRIEVIDSKGLTMWQGLVALAAAQAAAEGNNLEEVVMKAQQTIRQLHVLAFLDTAIYALKGGRLGTSGTVIDIVEMLFHFKLLLTLRNGRVIPAGFARSQGTGIDRLCSFIRKASYIGELSIGYSTTPAIAQMLADYARIINPDLVPRISRIGPALGVHTGPGALIAVFSKVKQSS